MLMRVSTAAIAAGRFCASSLLASWGDGDGDGREQLGFGKRDRERKEGEVEAIVMESSLGVYLWSYGRDVLLRIGVDGPCADPTPPPDAVLKRRIRVQLLTQQPLYSPVKVVYFRNNRAE